MTKPREADLYPAIKAHLTRQGYDVKGEVGAADVVALKGEEMLVVELKTGFSLTLFHQGVARQAVTDQVYLAVPAGGQRKAMLANVGLARRLRLGVMTVRLRDGFVEVMAEPAPFTPRKSPKKAKAIKKDRRRRAAEQKQNGQEQKRQLKGREVPRTNAVGDEFPLGVGVYSPSKTLENLELCHPSGNKKAKREKKAAVEKGEEQFATPPSSPEFELLSEKEKEEQTGKLDHGSRWC